MIKKIPIVGHPISWQSLYSGIKSLSSGLSLSKLCSRMSELLNSRSSSFRNSATSVFCETLDIIKKDSHRNEVILPAYTAASLVIAIRKAGLRPVLCDISLNDFNLDMDSLVKLVNNRTLCVVVVHLFGIVSSLTKDIKEKFPDILVVEDCAQSLGSKLNGSLVGSLGDLALFSFNRGKNLPTYGGGCISINASHLADKISGQLKSEGNRMEVGNKIDIIFKNIILSLIINPFIYGMVYPFISRFKNMVPSEQIEVKEYTNFQAGLALSLFSKLDEYSKIRYYNGMHLISGLKGIEDIILPQISPNTEPAFNRFPIVFKDLEKRDRVERKLRKTGIETSRMYLMPLHHSFDLGYRKDEFPKADYFAQRLLTVPVHPLVSPKDLERIIKIIKE